MRASMPGLSRNERLERLAVIFRDMDSVLVAFSGGVDSTLVLKVAHDVLGDRAQAATSVSPAVAASEIEEGRRVARRIGAAHHLLSSRVMDRPEFTRNSADRCYTCKEDLYAGASKLAHHLGLRWLANGTNLDDLKDIRPGLAAAARFGVRSPLIEAQMGKAEVREIGRMLGLENWDKPADACLSSRVPHGARITVEELSKIERAEAILKSEGFRQVRVRHHGEIARIEIPPDDFERITDPDRRERIVAGLRGIGFRFLTLDLQGYRQGSLNPAPHPIE